MPRRKAPRPIELTLHVAAGAVDLLVKIAGLALGTGERGDDEARIGLVFCPFRLRHDPALATSPHRDL